MEIKDAVRNAIVFARESLGPERTRSIRLEEVESSSFDSRPVWLITLSSPLVSESPVVSLRQAIGADVDREYEVFTVAKDDGEVLSMKIRLLATPTM